MSIFQFARQSDDEEPDKDVNPIFSSSKNKKGNIIPPVGIASPELLEQFTQNPGDEEALLKKIDEAESLARETPFQSAKRQVTAHAARAGEALVGSFGDMQSLIEMLTGISFPENENKTREDVGKFKLPNPEEFETALPYGKKSLTTNQLREKTKESTGGFLEPKDDLAKATQEIFSDIGTMANPTAGPLGFMNRLLLPIAGQSIKQSLKGLGFKEKEQEIGKMATTFMLSLANLGNAPRVAGQALNNSRNMLARGLNFSAYDTQNALGRLRNQPWFITGVNSTKQPAFTMIENIERSINHGQINGREAMQLREDINTARKSLGGFLVEGNPDKAQALRYLDQVDNALMDSMRNYGERVNPAWWRAYQEANEAFRVTKRSEAIADVISKYAKAPTSQTAKIAFGTALAHGSVHLPLVGLTAGGLFAIRKSYQIMNRMIRSPILRNHYLDVINAASQGNSAQIAKAFDKFDREAKRIEKKEAEFYSKSSPEPNKKGE